MKGYIHHAQDDYEVEAEVETAPRKPLSDDRFWAIIKLLTTAIVITGVIVATKMFGEIVLFLAMFCAIPFAVVYMNDHLF